jgi:hypothetical protein
MPKQTYLNVNSQATSLTTNASALKPNLSVITSTNVYNASLRKIKFTYPTNWTAQSFIAVEQDGVKRESVKVHTPEGSVAAVFTLTGPGQNTYFNPDNHLAPHEISVVVAKPVTLPDWPNPVLYTVIIVARPDGSFYLSHGLRSKHPLYDHVYDFISTQDEVPLAICEPSQTDPTFGFLVFMQGVWGLKTKADALAYLKTPLYKAVRNIMLTTRFS